MAATTKISDGTTNITFTTIDAPTTGNYTILTGGGWSPKVARRKRGGLATGSPYEDVVETMAIRIKGSSASDCLDKLGDLVDLLDQAARWSANDSGVSAVYIEYEASGSALANSVKAVITGPPDFGDFVTLPAHYTFVNNNGWYWLGTVNDPVVVSFTRRGQWIGASEAKATSTSTGNPVIQTAATFTDTFKIPVPFDIDAVFSGNLGDSTGVQSEAPNLHIATANAADKLYTIECEDMTGGAAAVVAGASAGNVDQQADSGTATLTDSSFDMNDDARLFSFFIMVKGSGTTTNWTLTAKLYPHDTINETVSTSRPVQFSDNSTTMIPFSPIPTNWKPSRFVVTAEPDAVNGETLNLDYIVGVAMDESSNIIKITPGDPAQNFDSGDEFELEQQVLTKKHSIVTLLDGAAIETYPAYNGGAYPYASGNAISVICFGNSKNAYILYDFETGGGQEANVTVTLTRYAGYLTPL